LRLIDPNGLDDAESNEQDKQKQVVKPLEDKIIQKRLKEIQSNAQPLAAGERPRPTTVEQIQGEQTILQNATVVTPEGQGEIANGYMQPIALAVLDQGGNIITDPNLSVTQRLFTMLTRLKPQMGCPSNNSPMVSSTICKSEDLIHP
jgi:hypothetical protein